MPRSQRKLTNAMNKANDGEVFEVFQQDQKDPAPFHGGNLLAPDTELAVHYAKEFYGRRQESQRLWIVPRSALWEVSDATRLGTPLHALVDQQSEQAEGPQTFAVFAQKQAGRPLLWLQDLAAEGIQAAVKVVSEMSQQNEETYLRLWLCPRSAIIELTNPDLLQPPLDRSYRRLDGYNIREKLRIARQRVHEQEKSTL